MIPVVAGLALTLALGGAGCSSWSPGVEIMWYTPQQGGLHNGGPDYSEMDSWVRIERAAGPRSGRYEEVQGAYTHTTLPPGTYEFEYLVPHTEEELYGELEVHGLSDKLARQFVDRTMLLMDPTTSAAGGGQHSIITEDDLRRIQMGDMVKKVVYVADLSSIEGRLAKIDEQLRKMQAEERRLAAQEEFWSAKLTDRRRNAMYFNEYGLDMPSVSLAVAQLAMGPEAYHWARFTEADNNVRHYQERRASLRLPMERLREERSSLRATLASMEVLHRRADLVIMMPDMIPRYHEPSNEVTESRKILTGPEYDAGSPHKSGMQTRTRSIGDLLMVVRLGARQPYRLAD